MDWNNFNDYANFIYHAILFLLQLSFMWLQSKKEEKKSSDVSSVLLKTTIDLYEIGEGLQGDDVERFLNNNLNETLSTIQKKEMAGKVIKQLIVYFKKKVSDNNETARQILKQLKKLEQDSKTNSTYPMKTYQTTRFRLFAIPMFLSISITVFLYYLDIAKEISNYLLYNCSIYPYAMIIDVLPYIVFVLFMISILICAIMFWTINNSN